MLARPPIAVVADDAVDHHQDAKRIGVIDEAAKRLASGRDFLAPFKIEPKHTAHGRRGRGDVAFQARRVDKEHCIKNFPNWEPVDSFYVKIIRNAASKPIPTAISRQRVRADLFGGLCVANCAGCAAC